MVRRQLSVKHRDQNSAPKKQNTDPKKKRVKKNQDFSRRMLMLLLGG